MAHARSGSMHQLIDHECAFLAPVWAATARLPMLTVSSTPLAALCRVPPSDRTHLGLQAVVQLAEEVGGADHGFR